MQIYGSNKHTDHLPGVISSLSIVSSAEEGSKMFRTPDIRQVTVLTKAEWQRIQNEVHQFDREQERLKEADNKRKALHLRSKQMVKEWPGTIIVSRPYRASCPIFTCIVSTCEYKSVFVFIKNQRKKKLEAKKIREQIMEEKRKQIDIEEAEYNDQQRKEIVVNTKNQLYNQTLLVRGFHVSMAFCFF